MSRNQDWVVAVVTSRAEKARQYPHGPATADSGYGTGDVNGRHRSYRYYEGVSPTRALELAAYDCAARCVDYDALELTPNPLADAWSDH